MANKTPIYLQVDSEFYSCLQQLKAELQCSWASLFEHLYRSYRGAETRKAAYVAEPDDIEE